MRAALLVKNLLFTVFVPATVAVYVPYALVARHVSIVALGLPRLLIAAPFFLLGAVLYGWCVWNFASIGRGTPAPIDPPRALVARGPYRYVRNPMYLGVLCVIMGWVVLAHSRHVALYGLVVAAAMHTFVVVVEERELQRRFGAAYDTYRRRVRRWIPGRERRITRRELKTRDFELPAWAEVGRRRREHIQRVAELLDSWADEMEVSDAERDRWLKAAWLHDALRDADLADQVTHGGAAADRAAQDGEKDQGVLDAIRYHSTGYAGWDDVGKMLYLADYLEPGRKRNGKQRSRLADRVPQQRDRVLRRIVAYEIRWRVRQGRPVHPLTIEFWNALARR